MRYRVGLKPECPVKRIDVGGVTLTHEVREVELLPRKAGALRLASAAKFVRADERLVRYKLHDIRDRRGRVRMQPGDVRVCDVLVFEPLEEEVKRGL